MKTEEYRTQYGQRKESRNRELELLRQTIIVYRQIVRKKLAEMDSAQALHDSAGYEKCLAEYTDAVKSEERFKCMFISVQREPLFTAEEREQIASDIQHTFQMDTYGDAVKVLGILEEYWC